MSIIKQSGGVQSVIYSSVGGHPGGLAVDTSGNVYAGANDKLIRIAPDESVSTLSLGYYDVRAIALDGNGYLYVGVYDPGTGDYRVDARSQNNVPTTVVTGLGTITGLAVNNGELSMSQGDANEVLEVNFNNTYHPVVDWVGNGTAGYNGDDQYYMTHIELNHPAGLATSQKGIFIADRDNKRIREVSEKGFTQVPAPTNGPNGPPSAPPPPPPPPMSTSTVSPTEVETGHDPSETCGCSQGQATRYPVNTATGDFWHTFTDLTVPGRGLPLDLTRTYNSNLAAYDSPLGYGWSFTYGMSLIAGGSGSLWLRQEDGSMVQFLPDGSGGYAPAVPRVLDSLTAGGDGSFTVTRRARQVLTFTPAGQLTDEKDLNGETTSLSYDVSGDLRRVTDAAGRSLTITTTDGRITQVRDDTGRTVDYGYDPAGELQQVTDADGGVWTFTYDDANRLLTALDPNQQGAPSSQPLTNVYDRTGRVTSQTDPAGRTTTFAYSGNPITTTTITDLRGEVTVENYTNGALTSKTEGSGTPQAATWSYAYDSTTFATTTTTDPPLQQRDLRRRG